MKLTKAQKNLVLEYARLAALSELSELEADRMGEILELAESDDLLSIVINEVDYFILQELHLLDEDSIHHYENQKARIKEFIEPRLSVEQDEYVSVGAEVKPSAEEPQAVVTVPEFKVRKQKANNQLMGTVLGVLAVVGVGGFSYYSNLGGLRSLISDTEQKRELSSSGGEIKIANKTLNNSDNITLESHSDIVTGIPDSSTIANGDSAPSVALYSSREITIDDIHNSGITNDQDTRIDTLQESRKGEQKKEWGNESADVETQGHGDELNGNPTQNSVNLPYGQLSTIARSLIKTTIPDGNSDITAADIATIDTSTEEDIAIEDEQLIVQDKAIVEDIQLGGTGDSVSIFDLTGTEFDSFSNDFSSITIGQANSSLDFSISQQITARSLLGLDFTNLTDETLTVTDFEPLTLPNNRDIVIGNMNSSYGDDSGNSTLPSNATTDGQTPTALFANSSSSEDTGELIIDTNRLVLNEDSIAASPNEELSTDKATVPRSTRNTASIGPGILTSQLIEGGQAIVALLDVSLIDTESEALRDSDLFHSFSELNIEDLQPVYVDNPTEIDNILSRVAGSNPSNIFGTLGVADGTPNLVFLNPIGIELMTSSLKLTNGSDMNASTFGVGNAGAVKITATDSIRFDGENNNGITSTISSSVNLGAKGNSGGIEIETSSLQLTNGAIVSTSSIGNAGSINITATDSIHLTNGASVSASTRGVGNAGNISVRNSPSIFLDNNSFITTVVESISIDSIGGEINIQTNSLSLENNSQILAPSRALGRGGNINVSIFNNKFDIDDTVEIKQLDADSSQELYQLLFTTDEPEESDKQ
ncbi:MAG: filamentous hemagglutinin N-terminal domain-containing protein [Symploca sp. SIO1B1]|nr:filamentous hemagglutinin N-terminal domain-containing protein [Symploca sp. SIO1B1]